MKIRRVCRLIPFLCLLLVSASASGCGSASKESYLQEVGELCRKAAEAMQEAAHYLEDEASQEGGTLHAAATSLEETSEAWRKMAHDLSRVRVPAGLENFHSELMELCASGEELCRLLGKNISGRGGEGNSIHDHEGAPHSEGASEEGTPGEESPSGEGDTHAPAGTESGDAH